MSFREPPPHELGEYIFMGMAKCNGHTVCVSVGYNLDYAVKKAAQFEKLASGCFTFYKTNVVRVGDLEPEYSIDRKDTLQYE